MSQRLIFNDAELATATDFTNVGVYAQADSQAIIGGAIGAPNHWSRFSITQPTATTLVISAGTLFKENVGYDSGPTTVDLSAYLPLISGDSIWIAILVRGVETTINDTRVIYTDASTGSTVPEVVPKTDVLSCTFVPLIGTEGPTPLQPAIPVSECCIAFVLMTQTGIQSITPGSTWRLTTLFELNGKVTILESELADVVQRTATLETDVANIAASLRTIPRPELMQQIQTNLGVLNTAAKIPDTARAYWEDPGLFTTYWNSSNSNWLARIWTGVRFPYAAIVNSQMAPLTAGDPLLKIVNNLAMPQWTETTRISVEGASGYKDISDRVHTVVTAVQNTVSRTSVSYGPTINVCQNQTGFAAVAGTEIGQTFTANGQTYVSDGLSTSSTPYAPGLDSPVDWNADPNSANHQIYAVQQLQVDSWTDTYWSYVTNVYGVNGSIYGQTFLISQPTICTSVDLDFTRVDTEGDVNFFLCETDATGAPNFLNVLAQCTVAASALAVGWVKFSITPTLLESGKRYAFYTVTDGNHALATTSGNSYAQGSLFWCTDGIWAQGDTTIDFCFHLNAAQFASTRTVVNFQPIAVADGMTEIRLLYGGWAPSGTQLVWEILPAGQSSWSMLVPNQGTNNPLYGLPALCQLRVTFVGTTDLMPAILLDTNARTWGGRMQGSMAAPSVQHAFGFSSSSVTVVTTLDNYDSSVASFTQKLLKSSGTILTPSTVSTSIDPNNSLRRTVTSVFDLSAAPQTGIAVMPTLSTTNVQNVPFVQDVVMFAT